jgi:hypothetical protein
MTDPIRAALERLIELRSTDTHALLGLDWHEAFAAARAALAGQQGEGPSESDVAELFYRYMGAGPGAGFENAIAEALARWGHQPAPHDDRGVLPMVISDTGASDEPERERIICASISGGADYVNNMPRTLTLERIELHKDSTCGITNRRYIQEPTPPAEAEVAELVARLRTYANVEQAEGRPAIGRSLSRAAELLERLDRYDQALSAVMPSDFKDWWQNSKDEWPDVAAGVIENLRKREELAWEQMERLSPPQGEVEG